MKVLILFFLCLSLDTYAQEFLLKPKFILDIESGKLLQNDILVKNGIIIKVGKNLTSKTATIISMPKKILLPGLMDTHVHLIGNTDLQGYENISESSYLSTIYGVMNAKKTLYAGFTTVRNVGASNFTDVALRDAINRGIIDGPRMLVSGPPLGITGGHCDNNLLPYELSRPSQGVVDSPWEARKKVRENRKFGADLIKFCATGGVMSKNTDVNAKQFTFQEMEAIVEEAHNHGMKVAAHAHGLEGIKTAINAGVDSVEHSSFIDEETIMLAIKNDVFLSMDIYVSDYILGEGALNGILEESLEKERKTGRLQRENFRKAVNLGAKITFGTDAGIFEHGNNAKQFKYMVKWGMTSLQAIQASTIVAADLLGINNIANIKENFYADIIGVEDNPIVNIEALENVTFVMKGGSIIINQP